MEKKKDAEIALLKEESEAKTEVIRRLVARCEELQAEIAQTVSAERDRIIDYLQELLELSEKVPKSAIKVKMTNILQALKTDKESHGKEKGDHRTVQPGAQ